MADMDTYDGDQRGYEGNYTYTSRAPNYGNGMNYGHSEKESHHILQSL